MDETYSSLVQENEYLGHKYYLSLNFSLSNVTRSVTESDGTTNKENNGIIKENEINNVNLFFFDATNESSTYGTQILTFSIASTGIGGTSPNFTVTQQIQISDLKKLLGKTLHIYALVNITDYTPATDNTKTEEQNFLNSTFSVPSDKFGDRTSISRNFQMDTQGIACPMSNYEEFVLDLSDYSAATDQELISAINALFSGTYGSDGKLYKVSNSLSLERMIARIDFTDGSPYASISSPRSYTYKLNNVKSNITDCNIEGGGVYLKIHDMQIFNAAQSAYVFRHTAAGNNLSATIGSAEPFSKENSNENYGRPSIDNEEIIDYSYRWIADNDWSYKSTTIPSSDVLSSNHFFNQPSLTSDENPKWYIPKNSGYTNDIALNTPETVCSWLTASSSDQDYLKENSPYAPWFYVMENTLPSTSKMNKSFATGVVFHAVLCINSNMLPYTAENNGEVRITDESTGEYKILEWMEANPNDPEDQTGYYYLTYVYLIPHNVGLTSSVDGETGVYSSLNPMGIGVVRNNIYQLKLTGINNLPSPEEPDNYYLSMEIKVLAWAKRDITVSW
ncbi:MAG: fimbria major subunit [Muribaculaceae bacterium]|nr:fimbria major subunit [Muribaculaceae bacterium]